MADAGRTMIDQDALVTVRTLLFPVQYEKDPASQEAVEWVIEEVIDGDATGHSRAEYLEDIRRALATDEDLATLLQSDVHTDAQIRAFLRALAVRLETSSGAQG